MSFISYIKNCDIDNIDYDTYDDMIIVEGIAADTSRDIVGDMASKTFLKKLAADLPGRPVFYNHNYKMPQLGIVLDAKTIDDGDKLWARAGIYKSQTNENTIRGLQDGSMRFFSVGAIGKRVFQGAYNSLPTRIFDDGYGQELTITGVPINPTAAFKVAKSHGVETDGYNNTEDLEMFIKAVSEGYCDENGNPLNVLEERNRIANEMEEFFMTSFMKGNEGMINPQYWENHGHTSGQWDSLNPPAAKKPGMSDLRPEGGQLAPQTLEGIIRKAMSESSDVNELIQNVAFLVRKAEAGGYRQAEEDFQKGYGYDHLNGVGRGPGQFSSWGPGGEGVLARMIAQEIVDVVGKENRDPNYGTHPWDAQYLRQGMNKVTFKERGYDEPFIDESVSRAGPESLGPVGAGKNPGVHPIDQEFLKQGLQELPPALKSGGYVHGGMTNIQKAEDLLEDPRFMKFLHATKYLYNRGQGEEESGMTYIHRLLHERGQVSFESAFRKAIDEEIIKSMNTYDFDNMTIEDSAALEHIMQDFAHADVFHKCMDDDRSIFSELVKTQTEEYDKSMPPWLDKKGDKKGKDDDDEEEDDDDDDKKDDKKSDKKKGKGDWVPPWADKKDKKDDKKDDKKSDDDDEEEDDDDDDEKDVKKSDESLDNEDEILLKAALHDIIRERLIQDQEQAAEYTKGLTTVPMETQEQVSELQHLANDGFERGVLQAIERGYAN